MTHTLARASGGEVTVVHSNEEYVTLEVSAPSPPGSSLELLLEGAKVAVKVRGCRREGERFVIDGRWVNLSRTQREALARFAAG